MVISGNFLAENDPKRSRNVMEPLRTPKTVRKRYKTMKIKKNSRSSALRRQVCYQHPDSWKKGVAFSEEEEEGGVKVIARTRAFEQACN